MTDRPNVSMIGKSIVIKGELSADEDVVIEGQVEGNISLNQNVLTVGEHGKVKAKIAAKTVVVVGNVWDRHHSCRERRYPRHVFGGRRHLHVAAGDGRWGLCPRSHRHTGSRKAEGPPRRPTADRVVHAPDKFRAKYAAKPASGPATGAPGLKR